MNTLTIGKLARQASVTVETLRYYEHRGLIAPRQRTETLNRLRFIRRAQLLGFSLDEITDLLSLSDNPAESADKVKRLTEAKIADIDGRLRDLKRMKQALATLAEHCPGNKTTTADCPILAALNYEES